MTPLHPRVISLRDARLIDVLGSQTRVRLGAEDTGGAFALFEVNDIEGVGVPRHTHTHEDETFHVISGVVQLKVGEDEFMAGPDTTVFGPRGVPHSWIVEHGPAKMLIHTAPAALEQMFDELGELPMPPDIAKVAGICARYGITIETSIG
ncbi:MAG: cupin domain-containing protein [Planctomycetota bacterium]